MAESPRTRLMGWGFNFFLAYRGTGGRITYIASDYREVRVRLPLSWCTRNYEGTIFGGSIYGAVDPLYMIILIKLLGPDYVVWDKAATVQFKKPGRTTLYARFTVTDEELAAIKRALTQTASVDRLYQVDLTDAQGMVQCDSRAKGPAGRLKAKQ